MRQRTGEERRLRAELSAALSRHREELEDELRVALVDPIDLGEDAPPLQFEVCPQSFRIVLCATEAELMPAGWLLDALPADWTSRAEAARLAADVLIAEGLMAWFADAWHLVGGSDDFDPAYVFWNGFGPRFDLAGRRWLSIHEVFADLL